MATPSPTPVPSPTRRRARSMRMAVVGVCASLLLAGCFTGQRPSFEETQPSVEPTGNPNIDAVLERLEGVSTAVFTADYSILTKLGNINSTARVVQTAPDHRSITINNV